LGKEMSEEMTIEKAREIISPYPMDFLGEQTEFRKVYSAYEHNQALAYIAGWESRQKEVDELKKKAEAYEIQLMTKYREESK
jgi:hypothetical protein